MSDLTVLALVFLIIALTYMSLTTRVKFIGVLAVVPAIVLAINFGSEHSILLSLAFVVVAIFNSWYAFFGTD